MLLFYVVASVTIASALAVVWAKSPAYSLLSLLVTMSGLAMFFVLLDAVFLAALQMLIYAGAVLVLFLFVVMLLSLDRLTLSHAKQFTSRWLAWGLGLVLLWQLIALLRAGWSAASPPRHATPETIGTIAAVGRALFADYLLPFEVTSLLILAGIIGAVALAQRKSST